MRRRKLRRVVGVVTILLGLLLVSAVAYSILRDEPKSGSASRSTGVEDPEVRQIDPIDPGGSKPGKLSPQDAAKRAPDFFSDEYGDRGEHEVTLTIRGTGYKVSWRDGHEDDGAGGMSRTRTVKGGFPLVVAFIVGNGPRASCTVTVDGIEKASESATKVPGAIWCVA